MLSPVPATDADPPSAALLERFELIERLGTGASGTVWRARAKHPIGELEAGAEVAVKVLRLDRVADADAQRQLAREAEVGRTVRSEHVIRIWAAERDFVVMEFVAGRTLREFLAESGPVAGELARRIGEHAARGLHALHRLGIVHRDIKPENLLLTRAGELKVMDLGLAHIGASAVSAGNLGSQTSGGFHGSFAYAAPEVLRGRPHTPAADLYAVGVVLFEVATGRHPFADCAGHPDEMIHAHLERTPPRASHFAPRVSTLLDVVIGELLAKDPEQRLGPASEVARILQQGEDSAYWRDHEANDPALASQRRLQAMRRQSPTRMVGRREERRRLDRALRATRQGRGGVVHVVGPTGVGRRRLLDEVIDGWLDDHQDILFVGGRADRRTADLPATPFPQILLDYLLRGEGASSPNAAERVRARLVEDYSWPDADARRLAEVVTGSDTGIGAATRADLIVRAIAAIAATHRCTIVRIDRAERLDAAGALAVRALADAARQLPLLLLLVEPSTSSVAARQIRVGAMELDDFVELGRELFRDGHAPIDLLTEAHESLTGHPGALLASLEECEEDGLLRGRPGDYHDLDPTVGNLRPTRTAMQRLRVRLAELGVDKQFVLQNAAVLGREFALADLAALVGRSDFEVLEALASFDGRLVHTQHELGVFAHRDMRRALLASIDPAARRRMHRAAAWLLEDRGAPSLEVGMHLSRAGLDQECLDPLLAGLARLVATGSRRVALRVGERIRLHLDRVERNEPNQRRRLRLLLLASGVQSALGDAARARLALQQASQIAEQLGDPIGKTAALVGIAELEQSGGRFVAAMALLADVENMLGDDLQGERAAIAARAFGLHSRVMAFVGHVDEALSLARRAADLAPADQPILGAHLAIDLGRWRALHTHFAAADDAFEHAAELTAQSGDVSSRLRLLLHRGRLDGWLGARELGDAELRECLELARRVGDARIACRAELFSGEIRVCSGEIGRSMLLRARSLAERLGDRVTIAQTRAFLVLDGDESIEPSAADDVGVPFVSMLWHLARAVTARRRGDPQLAQLELDAAVDLEQGLRVPLPLRVVLLRAVGREAAARRLPESVADRLPRRLSRRRFSSAAASWRVL